MLDTQAAGDGASDEMRRPGGARGTLFGRVYTVWNLFQYR